MPKANWPAAVIAVAALAGYVYLSDSASKDWVREQIERHHPEVDTRVEVHGNSIETLFNEDDKLREDLRAIIGRGR
jgi:hypothetical protein